jgi:carbamoyl-phosphate synthase small subunit
LVQHGVPGIQGIDTRALVRHLRSKGAMRCVISTDGTSIEDLKAKLEAWPGMVGRNLASEVSCTEAWVAHDPAEPTARFAVVDGGCKKNIVRLLAERGCYVRVHPLSDPAEAWTKDVDAVLVSNGPGDPAAVTGVPEKLRQILGTKPVVGICLGHQLLALALGATTYKLKFGHRGANQPVRDERTGRVQITSQNHGFAVDTDSLLAAGATVTHTHLNDGSVSGFAHLAKRVLAVQYHPEANPGPHDGEVVIDEFVAMAKEAR